MTWPSQGGLCLATGPWFLTGRLADLLRSRSELEPQHLQGANWIPNGSFGFIWEFCKIDELYCLHCLHCLHCFCKSASHVLSCDGGIWIRMEGAFNTKQGASFAFFRFWGSVSTKSSNKQIRQYVHQITAVQSTLK